MPEEYFIEKERVLLPSHDFQFLFDEGLKYVEKLGHKFWTDYNLHDPGIAILDVLCYAITELGYRADFDIEDLLTNKDGIIKNNTFFTAANIFSNAPLSEIDYRKLLIDIKGVSNAWFLATQKKTDSNGDWIPNHSEADIYINKLEDKLSLQDKDRNNKTIPELLLRGLNKVKIELEEDPELGDLNTLLLNYSFWHKNRWVNMRIIPQFTNWKDPGADLFKEMNEPSKITIESIKKSQNNKVIHLVVNRNALITDSLHFRIFSEDVSEIDVALNYLNDKKHVCELISLFEKKKDKIQDVFASIEVKLQQNRNLTEDYLCNEIIEKVHVGICADIEIEAGVDHVEIMAKIYIEIDKIISPKINFYTLSQLVEEGHHSEDIFAGPKLNHGFLKDSEIENSQLPTEIHASDIIAVLMEIDGVRSVENMLMTAYNELGKPFASASNQSWVLKLSGDVKPVFDPRQSKLLLFQKNIPFLLSENQLRLVEQKVDMYKTQFSQKKLVNSKNDFEIEKGNYFELDNYYSIQDDFPANFSIGKNHVSAKASNLRKAQAKQLQGYLYFYEQILADFFSQLYNAKDIFDTSIAAEHKTYFPVFLDKNVVTGEDFYSKETYSGALESILSNGESSEDVSLYESKTLYYNRKNRVLDHLIARFAESFNDYVFMMYQVAHDTSGMGAFSFNYDDLIVDKQNFINSYPEISSNRGLGIDYLNADIIDNVLHYNALWDTGHRGFYEKRVAKLLGINEILLRDIVTENAPQTQWTVEIKEQKFLFKIIDPSTNLNEKWDWAQHHFLNQNQYKIDKPGVNYYLYLVDGTKKIAKLEQKFTSENEAYLFLQKMIKTINIHFENFYCLEHILLRPFDATFSEADLLTVCLNNSCDDEANNDPYSFKATIVLPGYISRFRNLIFRKYAEKIFRQEAPAHVLLKICWVGVDDMLLFQKAYKNWIENYRHYKIKYCNHSLSLTNGDDAPYKKSLNELVKAINELNTIYPEGNLYDCQISEKTNPIILGNTSLGTI